MKSKVTITLTFEKNKDGNVISEQSIEGVGFKKYELIGLVQLFVSNLMESAIIKNVRTK